MRSPSGRSSRVGSTLALARGALGVKRLGLAGLYAALSACGTDTDLPSGSPDGPASDDVWDDRYVPMVRLTIEGEDWPARMAALVPEDDCAERPYLEASMEYHNPRTGESERYERVGVRYRGHSALSEGQRWGYKVSVNEIDPAGDFHGLHNLNLMGTEGDYSLMRERLAQWVMRGAGVPAPRVGHVQLTINDVYQGVFPFPEEADDDPFLDAHFDDDNGGFYKIEGYCGGTADFEDEGDDPDRYDAKYEPKADTTLEQLAADILPLVRCANEADAELRVCLPDQVNVDAWLTEIAVDMVLPDVDGFAGAGQNFLLYDDPADGRFVVVPWDKDQSFSVSAAASDSIWDLHPEWGNSPLLTQRIRALWKDEFCAEVLRVASIASPDRVEAELLRVQGYLEEPVSRDPWFAESGQGWHDGLDAVADGLNDRYEAVVAEATACTP